MASPAVPLTTASFVQPAVASTVRVSLTHNDGLSRNDAVYVSGGGYYLVTAVPDGRTVVLHNSGYTDNAAPSATVPMGAAVVKLAISFPVPYWDGAGSTGATGATGASGVSAGAARTFVYTATTPVAAGQISDNGSGYVIAPTDSTGASMTDWFSTVNAQLYGQSVSLTLADASGNYSRYGLGVGGITHDAPNNQYLGYGGEEVSAGTFTPGSTVYLSYQIVGPTGASGSTGPTGPTGVAGLTWRGTYSGTTAYAVGDAVEYAGSSYVAVSATTGTAPVGAAWAVDPSFAGSSGTTLTSLVAGATADGQSNFILNGSGTATVPSGQTAGFSLSTGQAALTVELDIATVDTFELVFYSNVNSDQAIILNNGWYTQLNGSATSLQNYAGSGVVGGHTLRVTAGADGLHVYDNGVNIVAGGGAVLADASWSGAFVLLASGGTFALTGLRIAYTNLGASGVPADAINAAWNEVAAAGNTVRSGAGAPSGGTTGVDGDFYLDTTASVLYGPMAAGAWPGSGVSLVGATGVSGAPGATGATGATGASGVSGASGVGLVWEGAYQSGTTYAAQQVVSYQGSSYIARQSTVGVAPNTTLFTSNFTGTAGTALSALGGSPTWTGAGTSGHLELVTDGSGHATGNTADRTNVDYLDVGFASARFATTFAGFTGAGGFLIQFQDSANNLLTVGNQYSGATYTYTIGNTDTLLVTRSTADGITIYLNNVVQVSGVFPVGWTGTWQTPIAIVLANIDTNDNVVIASVTSTSLWGVVASGATGATGVTGVSGVSAYTTTTASYTQPAASSTVSVAVGSTAWMAAGQVLYVAGGGYYSVSSITNATHVVLTNLGYAGNATPTSTVNTAAAVAPGGLVGATGATGVSGAAGVTGVTGVSGAAGVTGATGVSGVNAYTATTANFTQPAANATVSVSVGNTAWTAAGHVLYVAGGGYYSVSSVTNGTTMVLTNLGYAGNATATSTINSGAAVSPGGLVGVTGPTGPTGVSGISAYTATTASFTQPSVNSNVSVSVGTTAWMAAGETVYVAGGGYYTVSSVTNGTTVALTNTGATGNASSSTVIASAAAVTPGGLQGSTAGNFTYLGTYNSSTSYGAGNLVLYNGLTYATTATIQGLNPDGSTSTLFFDNFSSYGLSSGGNTALVGKTPSGQSLTYQTGAGSFTTSATIFDNAGNYYVSNNGANAGAALTPGALAVNVDFLVTNTNTANLMWYDFGYSGGNLEGHSGGFLNAGNATVSGSGIGTISTGDTVRFTRVSATVFTLARKPNGSSNFNAVGMTVTLNNTFTMSASNYIGFGVSYNASFLPSMQINSITITPAGTITNPWYSVIPYTGYPINSTGAVNAGATGPYATSVSTGRGGIITITGLSLTGPAALTFSVTATSVVATSAVFLSVMPQTGGTTVPLIPVVASVSTGSFSVQLFLPTGYATSGASQQIAYMVLT